MKERREGEKARKNMKEEEGLFPSLVLFFSSLFFYFGPLLSWTIWTLGTDYFISAIGPFIQISIQQ